MARREVDLRWAEQAIERARGGEQQGGTYSVGRRKDRLANRTTGPLRRMISKAARQYMQEAENVFTYN